MFGLLVFFTGCTQEEGARSPEPKMKAGSNHFYGFKSSDTQTKGVAQRINLWYPGSAITVKFLDGSPAYQQKVMDYAAEWEEYANITFRFVTEGNANVRIGFDWNENRWVTWSYIGSDCKMNTDQMDATLSFADWDYKTEDERKGDVLRAFGQVLGLELEHRHLDFDANWTNRIASYWEGEIEDVPWSILKTYVFDPLFSTDIIMTEEYDENSIMIWPFTSRYAGNTARIFNDELSELDKEYIAKIYPKEDEDEPLLILQVEELKGYFDLYLNDDVVIDWGDGERETVLNTTSYYYRSYIYNHTYSENLSEYTIKVYGVPGAISECVIGSCGLISFEIGKNSGIEYLGIYVSSVSYLDLSNASELVTFNCRTTSFTSLDFSGCSNLKDIQNVIFASNEPFMLNMLQTLPDRTGESAGTIYCLQNNPSATVISAYTAKNWTFQAL